MTGDVPIIACVFHQTVPLGMEPGALLAVLQEYVDRDVGPAWGVGCKLVLDDAVSAGEWGLVWTDNADQAGALGYHDDELGRVLGHVFVRTSRLANDPVSVVAAHELAEMLVDPGANLGAFTPRGRWAALEVCDAVETFSYEINGLPVSDFVKPAWFGAPVVGAQPYDYLGKCPASWRIMPGGYMPVWTYNGWSQIFGDTAAYRNYHAKDQTMRRNSRRQSRWAAKLAPAFAEVEAGCVLA